MFVKTSWKSYKGKKSLQHHVAESYRDPETKSPRHKLILNITSLPDHAIEAVRQALRTGTVPIASLNDIEITTGDSLVGAGLLTAYKAWKKENIETALGPLTSAKKQSVMAMVLHRIFNPGSKLSLEEFFENTIIGKSLAAKRLNANELYEVMDALHEEFYEIQTRLAANRKAHPVLCLYDITSTYFEGTKADEGKHGHSRDKRWDRYQIVIGLVCDEQGIPLALEVWPGNTADKTTVINRIQVLRQRFDIEKAIFVGDAGMYSTANIKDLERHGFDYIIHMDWHGQRKQLEQLGPCQLELFSRQGVITWYEQGVRYVGCSSENKRLRAEKRRVQKMKETKEKLNTLAETAAKGSYYSWSRLREKVNTALKKAGVSDLWEVQIAYAEEEPKNPDTKTRLELSYTIDEEALYKRKLREGKYVLRTSLDEDKASNEKIDSYYRSLQLAERAFRHIKSYLKVRPVYHYRRRRVRSHVLICFLAFYLVKTMELELRSQNIHAEVESLLKKWNQLALVQHELQYKDLYREDWQWSLGPVGEKIQKEIQDIGWWRSIDAYKRSLLKSCQ